MLQGHVNYADWSFSGWHPKTFAVEDITPELVNRMRGGGQAAAVMTATAPDAAIVAAGPALNAQQSGSETAAAIAAAGEATGAQAVAEVAAAVQLQESAGAYDDPPLPACEVAAAIHSATMLIFQPRAAVRQHTGAESAVDSTSGVVTAGDPTGGTTIQGTDGAAVHPQQGQQAITAKAAGAHTLNSIISGLLHRHHAHLSGLAQAGLSGRRLAADVSASYKVEDSAAGSTAAAGAKQLAGNVGGASWIVGAGYAPLDSHCALFARKFTAAVVNETLAMALSCAGLGLGSWCSDQQWLASALPARD
jgi:hypothetical protein